MLIFSLLEHSLKQHVQEGIYLPQKHTYNLHSLHYIMIPPSSPYWSQRLGNCPKFVFSVHSALNQSWISISSSFHIHPSHHHFPLLLSHVQPFATPWTTACQASLSFTISWSLLKLMSKESVMPSNHLTLYCPFSSVFNLSHYQGLFQWVSSSHQVAKVLEPQHQSLHAYSGLMSFRIDMFDLLAIQGTLKSLFQHN